MAGMKSKDRGLAVGLILPSNPGLLRLQGAEGVDE
jgi:hypothetical protein